MRSLKFVAIVAASFLGGLIFAAGANAAPIWSIADAAGDDIGTASPNYQLAPFVSFPFTPYLPTADPDKGCDDDAFRNFGGPNKGVGGIRSCGDTLIVKWAGGTVDAPAGNLTTTSTFNGTGLEFHVEDSSGTGTQNAFLPEILTVDGVSNGFLLPYTVIFGSAADKFQIPAFDIKVCIAFIGGDCDAQEDDGTTFWIISPGTALLAPAHGGDDDWSFETNLIGCVSSTDVGIDQCGVPSITVFGDPDPPPPAPEPATLALFGAGLCGLGALRRRRKAAHERQGN